MFCPNCGADNADGSQLCANCGTELRAAPAEPAETPEPAAEEAPAASKKLAIRGLWAAFLLKVKPVMDKVRPFVQQNKLLVTGIAGGVALILCIAIIIGMLTAGNGFTPYRHAIRAEINDSGNVIILYDAKKAIVTSMEASAISEARDSIDGSVHAFLTKEGELAVVKDKKVTVVADEVQNFILSVNGGGIGYIAKDGDKSVLYLYTLKNKKTTAVTDENPYSYDLSPDGKTIAYFQQDADAKEATLMYFNGSKRIKITSSAVKLLGLSNKGKYIYVVSKNDDNEAILYTYNTKGEREKLGACSTVRTVFNEDHTQILFYNRKSREEDQRSYISTKGKEGVKVSSSFAIPLCPSGSDYYSANIPGNESNSRTVPAANLYNKVYLCYADGQTNAWYLRKNTDKSAKLANNISNPTLDESGKYLYYINKDGDLNVLQVKHGDSASDKAKQLASDVSNYVVTSNRSKVYYVSEKSLYSCNGKTGSGKRTIASEDVSSTLVINRKDVVYYIMDGDVYACSNGRKGSKVVADGKYLYDAPNGVVCVETDDAIFATQGKKSLTKVYESN